MNYERQKLLFNMWDYSRFRNLVISFIPYNIALCNWKIHWLIIIGISTLVLFTLTVITIKALNYAYTEKDNKFYVLFRKYIGI